MPRSIEEWFEDFNSKLSTSKTETQKLKDHRASIKACLEYNFNMSRFFRSGSIGNWTNVSWCSDTDYFAWIPWNKLSTNSAISLRRIKEALKARFPSTSVCVDSPWVVVDFWTLASERTEIIPAHYLEERSGGNVYDIPDKNEGWMKSSPQASNTYVKEVNDKLAFKVKPLIRFVKAWKYYRNVPISSYYLEMLITKYADKEDAIVYLIDLKHIFKLMIDSSLARIINPTWIGGYITPCTSETKKDDALSKIDTAYTRICNAYTEESKGNVSNAFEWLDLLYNKKFPWYYN